MTMPRQSTRQRDPTDVSSLYFCIAFVLVVLGSVILYAFVNGSVFRIINGIDDCGNVCGRTNEGNTIKLCGSNNKTLLPFTLVNITTNKNGNITSQSSCVQSCSDYPGYIEIANRCFFTNAANSSKTDYGFFTSLGNDVLKSWSAILISCIVALVFSYILLVLFRYATLYVIWIIYIGLILMLLIPATVMIVLYFAATPEERKTDKLQGYLYTSGIFAVFAMILVFVILCLRKRIGLLIQLFKEASKALADIPLIVTEPILTFIACIFTCFAFLYFAIIIQSSGQLEIQNNESGQFVKATYMPNFIITLANYINLLAFVWFIQFIFGCQHFIIASTVGQWFFSRTKNKLDSPIRLSFNLLLRMHIGSICLGSIFITIVKILRMIVNGIQNSFKNSSNTFAKCVGCCCDCIVKQLEEILKYLVRNAYIIVAIDGTPLIESGKKAFRLITENLADAIALNGIGDFVLFMGKVIVTIIAGLVSYEVVSRNDDINMKFIPVILCVVFAFFIAHSFMTVFEMTLDTIFICFCIDCEENDGTSRPYYMSRKLMEVMMEMKESSGGELTNFGTLKHGNQSSSQSYGTNNEAGVTRPMIPANYQFSQ